LKELRDLSKDSSDVVKKLLILSELAVYKDLAPGYRIVVHHEDDPKVKVTPSYDITCITRSIDFKRRQKIT